MNPFTGGGRAGRPTLFAMWSGPGFSVLTFDPYSGFVTFLSDSSCVFKLSLGVSGFFFPVCVTEKFPSDMPT